MVQHADIDHTGIPGAGGSVTASACRVTRNAALNIGTSEAAVSWDNEVRDDGGYWVVGSPTLFTIPATDWYDVGGAIECGSTTGDWIQGYLRVNGSTTPVNLQFDIYFQSTTTTKALAFKQLAYLTAGDVVEIYLQAQASTAMAVGPTCNMWIKRAFGG